MPPNPPGPPPTEVLLLSPVPDMRVEVVNSQAIWFCAPTPHGQTYFPLTQVSWVHDQGSTMLVKLSSDEVAFEVIGEDAKRLRILLQELCAK